MTTDRKTQAIEEIAGKGHLEPDVVRSVFAGEPVTPQHRVRVERLREELCFTDVALPTVERKTADNFSWSPAALERVHQIAAAAHRPVEDVKRAYRSLPIESSDLGAIAQAAVTLRLPQPPAADPLATLRPPNHPAPTAPLSAVFPKPLY